MSGKTGANGAEKAFLHEVGPRDGLQMVKTILTTEQKVEWCRRAAAAGIPEIEVTSFVPPSVVPQFADAADVARATVALGGFEASALIPNLKGAEFAIASGIHTINFVMSASEEHNLANVRRSTERSMEDFRAIVELRDRTAGDKVRLIGGIATSFGCSIAGVVPEKRVMEIAETYLEAGADGLIVADTVGFANPAQVHQLMGAIVALADGAPVTCHFHDTRGLGLANVVAALEAGVRAFDTALAGLGGCPFAPGATGNINTEDTAFLLESLGFDTGVDIKAMIELRKTVEDWLPGERFSGSLARAGLPATFRRAAA